MDQREFARRGQAEAARRKSALADQCAMGIIEGIFLHHPSIEPHQIVGKLVVRTGWSRSKAARVWARVENMFIHRWARPSEH